MAYEAVAQFHDLDFHEFVVQWPDDNKEMMLRVIKNIAGSLAWDCPGKREPVRCHCMIIRCDDPDPAYEEIDIVVLPGVPDQYASEAQSIENME